MGLIKEGVQRTFVTVSGDGKLRVQSKEGVEGAVKREGEDSQGNKFTKWELVYQKLSGMITNISLWDGEYGQNLLIDIKDEGAEFTLSVGTATQFGEDLLKRMPGVDLKKEITFAPYCIEDETNPKYKNKGIAVYQGKEIVKNAFWDGTKEVNGYPAKEEGFKDLPKKKKVRFYEDCRDYTVEFLEKNILPEFNNGDVIVTVEAPREEEISDKKVEELFD